MLKKNALALGLNFSHASPFSTRRDLSAHWVGGMPPPSEWHGIMSHNARLKIESGSFQLRMTT
jgi:hypothetical protein